MFQAANEVEIACSLCLLYRVFAVSSLPLLPRAVLRISLSQLLFSLIKIVICAHESRYLHRGREGRDSYKVQLMQKRNNNANDNDNDNK